MADLDAVVAADSAGPTRHLIYTLHEQILMREIRNRLYVTYIIRCEKASNFLRKKITDCSLALFSENGLYSTTILPTVRVNCNKL